MPIRFGKPHQRAASRRATCPAAVRDRSLREPGHRERTPTTERMPRRSLLQSVRPGKVALQLPDGCWIQYLWHPEHSTLPWLGSRRQRCARSLRASAYPAVMRHADRRHAPCGPGVAQATATPLAALLFMHGCPDLTGAQCLRAVTPSHFGRWTCWRQQMTLTTPQHYS